VSEKKPVVLLPTSAPETMPSAVKAANGRDPTPSQAEPTIEEKAAPGESQEVNLS